MDGLPAPAAGSTLLRRRIRTRRPFAALAEGAARRPSGVAPPGALSEESANGGRVPALLLSALLHLAALGALLASSGMPALPPAAPIPIRWLIVAEPAPARAASQAARVPEPARVQPPPRPAAARARPAPRPPPAETQAASELAAREPVAGDPVPAPEADGVPAPVPAVAATAALAVAAPADPGAPARIALPRGGHRVMPLYPRAARARGATGVVVLAVRIAPDGEVAELRVERSSGHADLDRSALAAMGRWRFEPLEGAVGAEGLWVQQPFEFRLDR